jgi:hypothetical protein
MQNNLMHRKCEFNGGSQTTIQGAIVAKIDYRTMTSALKPQTLPSNAAELPS